MVVVPHVGNFVDSAPHLRRCGRLLDATQEELDRGILKLVVCRQSCNWNFVQKGSKLVLNTSTK